MFIQNSYQEMSFVQIASFWYMRILLWFLLRKVYTIWDRSGKCMWSRCALWFQQNSNHFCNRRSYCEEYVCLSVCPLAQLENCTCQTSPIFSRASRMLRSATQVVRMPCVCHMYVLYVCMCVCGNFFFRTTPISKLVWPISMKFGMMGGLRG